MRVRAPSRARIYAAWDSRRGPVGFKHRQKPSETLTSCVLQAVFLPLGPYLSVMDDQQLLRYSRQIMLPRIGYDGQQVLLQAHVLIVGAGGLGSPAAIYLAGSGVGHITIADDDEVDLSNLQRQILHQNKDLGRPKVDSARETLAALNPDVRVTPLRARLADERLTRLVKQADLVVGTQPRSGTRL